MRKEAKLLVLITLFLVVGCGRSSNTEPDRQQKLMDDLILRNFLGLWLPLDGVGVDYEFFLAETETYNVTSSDLKTGRILTNGIQTQWFYWDLDKNGSINITVTDFLCEIRPLTKCPILRRELITPKGDKYDVNTWEIKTDIDINGIYEKTLNVTYYRKNIDPELMPKGAFYFSFNDHFSSAWPARNDGDKISIVFPGRVDDYKPKSNDIAVSAFKKDSEKYHIQLVSGKNASVEYQQAFLVNGTGYRDLTVRMWLEDVFLYASTTGSYSITYELRREVVIPFDVDRSMVRLEGVEEPQVFSRVLTALSESSIQPDIKPGDQYYSNIRVDFNKDYAADGVANEIIFTSPTKGVINRNDVIRGAHSESKGFEWASSEPGKIELHIKDYGTVYMSFISEIPGGYTVLYDLPYENHPDRRRYYVHDFIKDEGALDMKQYLPGKFLVDSATGSGSFEVSFFDDGTLEASYDGVKGYWFIGDDGQVYSYQCEKINHFVISDYEECLDMFSTVNTPNNDSKYIHVRKMKFLHYDGHVFKSAYSAAAWGDVFDIFDDEYIGFNWTYRWVRVGEAHSDHHKLLN